MAEIEPRFLTAADAARYLSVSVMQFRRLVDAGTLPDPVRLRTPKADKTGEEMKTGERFVRWDRLALDAAVLGRDREVRQRSIDDAIEDIAPRSANAKGRNGKDLRV